MSQAKENSGRGGWTMEQKYQLLLGIIKAVGALSKIPWDQVELPAGRTKKACLHAFEKIKVEAGMKVPSSSKKDTKGGIAKTQAKGGSGNKRGAGDDGEGTTAKKRKTRNTSGVSAKKINGNIEAVSGNESGEEPDMAVIKEETIDDDDDEIVGNDELAIMVGEDE